MYTPKIAKYGARQTPGNAIAKTNPKIVNDTKKPGIRLFIEKYLDAFSTISYVHDRSVPTVGTNRPAMLWGGN